MRWLCRLGWHTWDFYFSKAGTYVTRRCRHCRLSRGWIGG